MADAWDAVPGYVCQFPISLRPSADPAAFEQAMVGLVMPQLRLLQRDFPGLTMEHTLLRANKARGSLRYLWQVAMDGLQPLAAAGGAHGYDRATQTLEAALLQAVEPWGALGRRSVLLRVGGAVL